MNNLLNKLDKIIISDNFVTTNITKIDYKGYYILDNLKISMSFKPNIIQRFFMRLMFGFKWENNK